VRQALSDVTVVEIGTGVAAGWCGKAFADLGAQVVKVEPPGGDPLRGDAGMFAHLNTNKASAIVDVDPAAAASLWEVLDGADLVIDTPGMRCLRDWAITPEEVLARPPTSVLAITGFGATGPYSAYAWSDVVAQAFAGTLVMDRRGPVKLPMSLAETAIGHTAALASLASVLRARATGVGAFVDCAAYEVLASSPMRLSRYLGWEYSGRSEAGALTPTSSDTLLPIGVFPCADGYVAMMMTTQQLGEMLDVLGSHELRAAFAKQDAFVNPETKEILDSVLYPWLLERTREEVTDAGQAAGWPVAPVNQPHELLTADHLHQRGFWVHTIDPELGPVLLPGAPYRLTEGGWKLRRPAPRPGQRDAPSTPGWSVEPAAPAFAVGEPAAPPLGGLRVLDLTNVWSGPYLTQLLGDLGAEVIRVESPHVFPPTTKGYTPRPDDRMLMGALARLYGPAAPGQADRPYNRHAMNNSVSRNKLSCTLDVREPEQRELFMRLVALSDVFVENLKSTTLHQMGLHETELLQANPRLIVLRLPPAGLSGDWAHYTGFGGQFDGLTSLATLLGHRGTTLMETPSTQHMDSVTGPAGVFATLAALHYRAATGRGQLIELAQSENVMTELGDVFVNLQRGVEPQRYGNRDPHRAPQGIYACADGRAVALTVTDDDGWHGLAGLLGREDLAADVRLADAAGRQAAHDELDELIGAWASNVSSDDAFRGLQRAGVAAAPCLDDAGLAADPQVAAREWIRPLGSRDVGTFNHLGHPFRGIPLVWERGAPALGEHNEYVFKKILGLDDAEYDRLVAERVATEDYYDRDGNPY
jgi:crotonobetainyl-CoA:carnitine CoA-transferase CaiB-like acyl-CoA transferase